MIIVYEVTTHVKRKEPLRTGHYEIRLYRRRWRVVVLLGIVPLFAWMSKEERLCVV
jgi:hypothetical protein